VRFFALRAQNGSKVSVRYYHGMLSIILSGAKDLKFRGWILRRSAPQNDREKIRFSQLHSCLGFVIWEWDASRVFSELVSWLPGCVAFLSGLFWYRWLLGIYRTSLFDI